jgi:O-antigen/teichoic acid export membrane protein
VTAEFDSATLRQRAKRGVVFLALRTVAVQATTLVGNIALARQLTASEFGVFGVVQFVLSLFTLLGDVGLGAALIQRSQTPTREELSSVFWLQFAIALAVVGAVLGLSPWVLGFWPDLPTPAVKLVQWLSVSFVFVMLRAIPSVLLERQLSFGKLALLEFSGTLTFYATAVSLAYTGHGVDALLWAVLIQALILAILVFALCPWWPGFVFQTSFVRSVLGYGFAYQTKNLVGFANSAVVPLVAGRWIGTAAVGYLTWAQSAAYQPLRVVQLLARVNFPVLSRAQDPEEFRRFVTRGLELSGLAAFAFVAVCLGLGEHLVRWIYGEKWIPALPVFYVFVVSMGTAFIAPLATSTLEAAGKPRLTALMSSAWTLLNWVAVGAAMLVEQSVLVFALAYSVHVFVGNGVALYVLRREVAGLDVSRVLISSALATAIAAWVGRLLMPADPSAWSVIGIGGAILACFVAFTFVTNRRIYRELIATAGFSR